MKVPRDTLESIFDKDDANPIKVYCASAFAKHDIIAIKGMQGAYLSADIADPADPTLSAQTLVGVALYAVSAGDYEPVFCPLVVLTEIDTSAYATDSSPVFLGAGGSTSPAGTFPVGVVLSKHATKGSMLLCPALIEGVSAGQIVLNDAANFWTTDTLQGMADALVVLLGGTDDVTRTYKNQTVVRNNESFFASIDALDQAFTSLTPGASYRFLDDFDGYQNGFAEADHGWILHGDTADPAVPAVQGPGGIVQLTSAVGAGDRCQMVWATPVVPNVDGVLADFRFMIDDITTCAFFLGLTDRNTIDNPAEVTGGTDNVVALVAGDLCGVLFDAGGLVQQFRAAAFRAGVMDPGLAPDGLFPTAAPINGQWFRCVILADKTGTDLTFRLFDAAGAFLEERPVVGGSGFDPATDMFFTVVLEGRGAVRVLTVDYALGQAGRA